MAIHFKEGEVKTRPGLYQRQTSTGYTQPTATDGICAIPVQASWGPIGKVLKNVSKDDLRKNYGSGAYGTGYTVPAAAAMFDGGASVVYTYRMGTGGTKGTLELTSGLDVTAKYPGTMAISVAVQAKLGDSTKKQLLVYVGSDKVETWEFAADATAEGANLIAAVAKSKYIDVAGEAVTVPVMAVAAGALSGGANPTINNGEYSKAFAALEPYYYNAIALDVNDDEDMTLSLLLKEYFDAAHEMGKNGFVVVGEPTSVDFETRLANAMSFNDGKVVYLGSGYMVGEEAKDGVLAICYTAGAIAATPSNQSITRKVISGATGLCEVRTFAEYEAAITSGMLMLSMSSDGNVWYDSGITTLTNPESGTQDNGWKKIRRAKTRYEMFYRLDIALNPKVGRVSADSDGIADIIQSGQNVLNAMVNEGKLMSGATFMKDPDIVSDVDSAHFIIQADDIDSLEKIYLQYQFRYSQNS